MNAADLFAAGGEVSTEPVIRPAKWTNAAGEEKEFEIRVLPRNAASTMRAQRMAAESPDRDPLLIYIAAHAQIGNDHQTVSYEQVERIEPTLLAVIVKEVSAVHGEASPVKN